MCVFMCVCGCIMRVRGVWGVFGHFSHFRNFRFPYMGSLWKKFCGLQNFLLQGLSEIWGGYNASRKVTWTFWLNLNFRKNMIFFSKNRLFFSKIELFMIWDLVILADLEGKKRRIQFYVGKESNWKFFRNLKIDFLGPKKIFFLKKKFSKIWKFFFSDINFGALILAKMNSESFFGSYEYKSVIRELKKKNFFQVF